MKGKKIYAITGDSVLTSQPDADIKNLSHVHTKKRIQDSFYMS